MMRYTLIAMLVLLASCGEATDRQKEHQAYMDWIEHMHQVQLAELQRIATAIEVAKIEYPIQLVISGGMTSISKHIQTA